MMKSVATAVMMALTIFAAVAAGDPRKAAPPEQSAGESCVGQAKLLTLRLGGGETLKVVKIPAGKFLMGSPETEVGRIKDEVQHEVTISKPFYMGTTHVTVAQFAAFVKESGYKTEAEAAGRSFGFQFNYGKFAFKTGHYSWRDPGFRQKGDHPVVHVSWNDAKAFCEWLSKKSGKNVLLPTEAQWEYACRAGTTTAYPWGDDPADGKGWANCADQSLSMELFSEPAETFFKWDDGFAFTSPVGSFRANAFGLYDMPGNALQWCRDCYSDYDKDPVTDPTGPPCFLKTTIFCPGSSPRQPVLRGGSWHSHPAGCRSAYRAGGPGKPSPRSYYQFNDTRLNVIGYGFRVGVFPAGENWY